MTRVHNHLEVGLPEGDYRDDAELTTAANNLLSSAITVPPDVEATAKDGDVTVTGAVRYGSQRLAAAAWSPPWSGSATSRTTSRCSATWTGSTSRCGYRRRWTAMRWSPMRATERSVRQGNPIRAAAGALEGV